MKIVLFRPCIPQNTGNIIRTCKVTGADLMLVKPLGFRFSSRLLKRAGLDYAEEMNIEVIDDLASYLEITPHPFYFFSSKATNLYTDVNYTPDTHLIFGSETEGISEEFWKKYPSQFVTMPMQEEARCLNLSNTVAIATYEAWRQQGFIGSNCFSQSSS